MDDRIDIEAFSDLKYQVKSHDEKINELKVTVIETSKAVTKLSNTVELWITSQKSINERYERDIEELKRDSAKDKFDWRDIVFRAVGIAGAIIVGYALSKLGIK